MLVYVSQSYQFEDNSVRPQECSCQSYNRNVNSQYYNTPEITTPELPKKRLTV